MGSKSRAPATDLCAELPPAGQHLFSGSTPAPDPPRTPVTRTISGGQRSSRSGCNSPATRFARGGVDPAQDQPQQQVIAAGGTGRASTATPGLVGHLGHRIAVSPRRTMRRAAASSSRAGPRRHRDRSVVRPPPARFPSRDIKPLAEIRKDSMPYSATDVVPPAPGDLRPVRPDPSWSDRCYFFAASRMVRSYWPVGTAAIPTPAPAWDIKGPAWPTAGTRICSPARSPVTTGGVVSRTDALDVRGAVEEWRLDVEPNASGIAWELYYEPTAPMWELLPDEGARREGDRLADMYHAREARPLDRLGRRSTANGSASTASTAGAIGRSGCASLTRSTSGCGSMPGSRTTPSSVDHQIRRWRATCTSMAGSPTDGTLSKRFVAIEHDVGFDGDLQSDRRRPCWYSTDGTARYQVTADTQTRPSTPATGCPCRTANYEDLGNGGCAHPLPLGQQRFPRS